MGGGGGYSTGALVRIITVAFFSHREAKRYILRLSTFDDFSAPKISQQLSQFHSLGLRSCWEIVNFD